MEAMNVPGRVLVSGAILGRRVLLGRAECFALAVQLPKRIEIRQTSIILICSDKQSIQLGERNLWLF